MDWKDLDIFALLEVEVGSYYKHFKGTTYQILALATDTETLNINVIYQDVKTKQIWSRSIDGINGFCTPTESGELRFTKLNPPE